MPHCVRSSNSRGADALRRDGLVEVENRVRARLKCYQIGTILRTACRRNRGEGTIVRSPGHERIRTNTNKMLWTRQRRPHRVVSRLSRSLNLRHQSRTLIKSYLSLPPQSAASFISNQVCNVGFWHIATFRCAAKLVAYWTTTD